MIETKLKHDFADAVVAYIVLVRDDPIGRLRLYCTVNTIGCLSGDLQEISLKINCCFGQGRIGI